MEYGVTWHHFCLNHHKIAVLIPKLYWLIILSIYYYPLGILSTGFAAKHWSTNIAQNTNSKQCKNININNDTVNGRNGSDSCYIVIGSARDEGRRLVCVCAFFFLSVYSALLNNKYLHWIKLYVFCFVESNRSFLTRINCLLLFFDQINVVSFLFFSRSVILISIIMIILLLSLLFNNFNAKNESNCWRNRPTTTI